MKVLIDWTERYPDLYLGFGSANGAEVPDDVAERWRATYNAWWALAEEVRAFEEGLHGTGSVTQ